jgi:hypothetical protein
MMGFWIELNLNIQIQTTMNVTTEKRCCSSHLLMKAIDLWIRDLLCYLVATNVESVIEVLAELVSVNQGLCFVIDLLHAESGITKVPGDIALQERMDRFDDFWIFGVVEDRFEP